MAIQDPRILIILLNDLLEELKRWTITTRDTLTDMSWYQNQGEEKVTQAQYKAAIVQDKAKNDRKIVDYAQEEVTQLLSNCYRALDDAQDNLVQAENSQNQAQSTANHWKRELNLAIAWLERAKARLTRAIMEREDAEVNLRNAESDLRSAEAALSSCRNSGYTDKEGRYHAPNCSGEQSRVSAAQAAVQNATRRLNQAIAEENAARQEVAQAQARVNCCRTAVGYAEKALNLANIALNNAHQAISFAERSLENAHAAQREVERADIEAIKEQEMADLMSLGVNKAQTFTEEARSDFKGAEHLGDSAQQLEVSVSRELEERLESLIEFNRPCLF